MTTLPPPPHTLTSLLIIFLNSNEVVFFYLIAILFILGTYTDFGGRGGGGLFFKKMALLLIHHVYPDIFFSCYIFFSVNFETKTSSFDVVSGQKYSHNLKNHQNIHAAKNNLNLYHFFKWLQLEDLEFPFYLIKADFLRSFILDFW